MTRPDGPDRAIATRGHDLLRELVNDALDPGYAEAARRRGDHPGRRWFDTPAVVIGCLAAGFLLVVAYVHTNRSAPQTQQVQEDLVARVRGAQAAVETLGRRVDRIDTALGKARAEALPSGPLMDEVARDRFAAGLVPVHGPGLVVTLSEPPAAATTQASGRAGTTPLAQTNILTDRDVRSVVNELWHDGAEAIAVNHVRLTPTSAIRFAGQAVLVDFEQIAPPYSIAAIGNANALSTTFAESGVASRYKTLSGVEGIGFTFTEGDNLTLPAAAPQQLRYATAAPTPTPSPSPSTPASSPRSPR
jgi:uncharacterized protein YlxW (UPF0749 family)